jgi:hypothetical protein
MNDEIVATVTQITKGKASPDGEQPSDCEMQP